ncbi:LemA family protein [soil metagenome]
MTTSHIAFWAFAAVLLFWAVGAHNRLVRLRSAIVRRFGPIDEQFALRHSLLEQQLEALAPVLANAGPRLDALRAACAQADTARAHAKQRPGAVGAITSLRLAEDILGEARARLPAAAALGASVPDLGAQLATSDAALTFARKQFNDAVTEYNLAVQQFPTWLLARLLGFRAAGTL